LTVPSMELLLDCGISCKVSENGNDTRIFWNGIYWTPL